MKMAQSLHRILYATVFIILNLIHSSHSFPAQLNKSPQVIKSNSQASTLLSVLQHRKKREVVPLPTTVPKVAAHYSVLIPRHFAPLHKPVLIYPIYYYHPRFYVRAPRYNNYLSPKSELFTTGDGVGNYINNLLPIFNKETPKVKVDPAPAELPAIPSAPVNGQGAPGVNQLNPLSPADLNEVIEQVNSWVWPDNIVSGKLPTVFTPELNKKILQHRELQHPIPSEPFVVGNAENALPSFALSGIDPQLVDKPAVISPSSSNPAA